MIKAIYNKDVYDKLTNKIFVSEIGTDDNKAILIFNLNSIKKVTFIKEIRKVDNKDVDKYVLRVFDNNDRNIFGIESVNRDEVLPLYNKLLGLLSEEVKDE
jgi:hypothetical protein